MKPAIQKPDRIMSEIRPALKETGTPFTEPPPGFGCDLIIWRWPVRFVEVKNPELRNQDHEKLLTDKEKLLRDLCKKCGAPWTLAFSTEEVLLFAGWMIE